MRAEEAGVELQLVEGDVTALADAGVGSGFQLLMDFGCFHDKLDDAERAQEGRAATAAAAPDASLLLLGWRPARRRFLPRGASREEIKAAFAEWTITDDVAMDVKGAPRYVRRADPRFYRLERN